MEVMEKNHDRIEDIIMSYGGSPDLLISILQDVQSECRYLPEYALRQVARSLDLPLIQVYGVATFFKAFSLKPRGKYLVNICLGTACHVRGAPAVLEEMGRQLGIKSGETTEDMQFTLESVNCLGACALGPIVVVDGKYYSQMSPGEVKVILNKYRTALKEGQDEQVEITH